MVETKLQTNGGSDIGAVIIGALIAVAITAVFAQFAAGIGYGLDSPLRTEGVVATIGVIAAGVWLLFTQVVSSLAGGYVAGRLRTHNLATDTHEVEVRDGIHGLATWALASVLVIVGAAVVAACADQPQAARSPRRASAAPGCPRGGQAGRSGRARLGSRARSRSPFRRWARHGRRGLRP